MCGLVGVMGKTIPENVKRAFHDMLYLDTLRGEDSTGVAAISGVFSGVPHVELFKSVGGASELFYEHAASRKVKSLSHRLVNIYIGHNRYATQGKVNTENAHPFEFPNLVGAHNGTVSWQSLKDFHGYKDLDVDSQIIYSHLSHTQDIREVWKGADGALALSWYDKVTRKTHLIRNKERPLWYAYTKDDQQIFWASEKWMPMVAAMRQGVDIQDVVSVKPDTLFTFTVNEEGKVRHTEEEIPPFVEKPIVSYYNQGQNSRGNYWNDYEDYWKKELDQTSPVKTVEKKKEETVLKASPCIITEFHDVPANPLAYGFTQSGKVLRINIPVNRYKEARGKIIGIKDSKEQGFFSVQKLNKSIINAEHDYWCNWSDCRYITLKPHMQIVRLADKSFLFKDKGSVTHGFAPCHDDGVFLSLSDYVQKTRCGCFNCKSEPIWAERNGLKWIDKDTFLCEDCQTLPMIKDLLNEGTTK